MPKSLWPMLAAELERRLAGLGGADQLVLLEADGNVRQAADRAMARYLFEKNRTIGQEPKRGEQRLLTTVDIDSATTAWSRILGPELLGHHVWNELQMPAVLERCGLGARERSLADREEALSAQSEELRRAEAGLRRAEAEQDQRVRESRAEADALRLRREEWEKEVQARQAEIDAKERQVTSEAAAREKALAEERRKLDEQIRAQREAMEEEQAAVGSSIICWRVGSHLIFRPRIIAMLARWQTVADRWPTSTGEIVCARVLTQSRKSRLWPWRWSPAGLGRCSSSGPIFSRRRPSGFVFRPARVMWTQPPVPMNRTP